MTLPHRYFSEYLIPKKWISVLHCSLLAPDQHMCSPQSEKIHLDRKQNLSLPGTVCSPLCSKVLTDRNMKSESGPIQALPLQAQAKPAVGSYGASYVTCSSFPMNPSSSSHAMLCIKLLISNSDNTCRSAPHLFPCTVQPFNSSVANS